MLTTYTVIVIQIVFKFRSILYTAASLLCSNPDSRKQTMEANKIHCQSHNYIYSSNLKIHYRLRTASLLCGSRESWKQTMESAGFIL